MVLNIRSIIDAIELNRYIQNFRLDDKADKNKFGIIYTSFTIINKMLDLIPDECYSNPLARWLDMGAGTGYFSICLFRRLDKGLMHVIIDADQRMRHIISEMLYMSEIKASHIMVLRQIFGHDANIYGDFLSLTVNNFTATYGFTGFDFIIGNPPYNCDGQIKCPTNKLINKKHDGETIWPSFIKKALVLLKDDGYLCPIIPSIWLKPDKAGIYEILTKYKINALHTFSNTETNKIFNYEAQTPTCFFLLQKTLGLGLDLDLDLDLGREINIYDKFLREYCRYNYDSGSAIPLHGITILNKLQVFVKKYGSLPIIKTNSPSKKSQFSLEHSCEYPYKNISTCLLDGLTPVLKINYSNIPQSGHGQAKLILAHKMYGFPYLDLSGDYGISARDNYIITGFTTDLTFIQDFLSTKLALFIYSCASYRMKYLEKYAFEFIPDISKMDWSSIISSNKKINDDMLAELFGLTLTEREIIEGMHKNYSRVIIDMS